MHRTFTHTYIHTYLQKYFISRICVGVFTAAEVSVSIYLNDEPILLLQPHTSSCTSSTTSSAEGLPQRTPVIMKPIER